jgi:hypothetical protein
MGHHYAENLEKRARNSGNCLWENERSFPKRWAKAGIVESLIRVVREIGRHEHGFKERFEIC